MFFASLRMQARVVHALLMREIITRYGRANLGFAWLFIEPMLFTLVITALWAGFRMNRVSAVPVVAFALTGYGAVLLWRNCVARASTAIPPNVPLLFHRNVRVLDLVLTRVLLEIGGATVSFVVLAAVFIFVGWCDFPEDMLKVFAAWMLLAWFGTAAGLVIGGLTSFNDIFERLWPPFFYMLFPLSGSLFMVEWLPKQMQALALWLPMVHGKEFLRDGFFGSLVRTHYDIGYLVTWCFCLTLLGLALIKNAARRIRFQ